MLFSVCQFLLCTFIVLGREEFFLDACSSPVTTLMWTHSEISIYLMTIAMEVIFVISRSEKLLNVQSILYIHFVSLAWSCPLKPRVKDGRVTKQNAPGWIAAEKWEWTINKEDSLWTFDEQEMNFCLSVSCQTWGLCMHISPISIS